MLLTKVNNAHNIYRRGHITMKLIFYYSFLLLMSSCERKRHATTKPLKVVRLVFATSAGKHCKVGVITATRRMLCEVDEEDM